MVEKEEYEVDRKLIDAANNLSSKYIKELNLKTEDFVYLGTYSETHFFLHIHNNTRYKYDDMKSYNFYYYLKRLGLIKNTEQMMIVYEYDPFSKKGYINTFQSSKKVKKYCFDVDELVDILDSFINKMKGRKENIIFMCFALDLTTFTYKVVSYSSSYYNVFTPDKDDQGRHPFRGYTSDMIIRE